MKAMERVRQKMSKYSKCYNCSITQKAGGRAVSKDYSFQVEGDNAEEINRIANAIMADMKQQSWFKDVKSSSEGGYPQAQLEVDRVKAESYGLSVTDITRMLNQTVLGVDPNRS